MGKYKNTNLLKIKHVLKEDFNNVSEIDLKVKELEENFKIKNNEESNKDILVYKSLEIDEIEFKKEYSLKDGINELKKAKVKFNEEDVIFVIRDKTNQLLWLEEGNDLAGLNHILERRKKLITEFGFNREKVILLIKNILLEGETLYQIVTTRQGKPGYERLCKYKDRYFILAIGLNGFIISIYIKNEKQALNKWEKYKDE